MHHAQIGRRFPSESARHVGWSDDGMRMKFERPSKEFRPLIANLTQHEATDEQCRAGVIRPPVHPDCLKKTLTFDELPSAQEILRRAEQLAEWASYGLTRKPDAAMIGGAPYLMSALEDALRKRGIRPLYAFSLRETVEETLPDGSVKKTAVFRHAGFVEPPERNK